MKKILIVFTLVATGIFYSFELSNDDFMEQRRPIKEIHRLFSEDLQELIILIDEADETLNDNPSLIKVKFEEVRNQFKKIEFILSYLDIQHFNQKINGAPLPKLEKHIPNIHVLQPKGLQVIQELVYDDEIDVNEIHNQYIQLTENLHKYLSDYYLNQLTDAVFFESTHYGLIRLYTLGLTGFDSPGSTQNTIKESEISYASIHNYLFKYAQYIKEDSKHRLNELSKSANYYFDNSFDDFDRLEFLRVIIDPYLRECVQIQKDLFIEMPYQRVPGVPFSLNYNAHSIFSDDFFNIDFYAENYSSNQKNKRKYLGEKLFYDPILSSDNSSSCATCHKPELAFTDGLSKSASNAIDKKLQRNAPTLLNAVYATRFFYDLRTDRLSTQMDHVVLNPDEFNSTYKIISEKLSNSETYASMFKEAFGTEKISREQITNAISAYVSSLRSFNSEFDQFIRGETNQISDDIRKGYNLFAGKAACATCHFIPTFSGLVPPDYIENESEVLGVPLSFNEPYEIDSDLGRFGNRVLKEKVDFYKYSFKTPSVRNVEFTAPYMHNGSFEDLNEVMEFYNVGGGAGLGIELENQTLSDEPLNLNDKEIQQIIAFMNSLSDRSHMD
ncbi:MAG: cytochrome c peroxidase [Bacteroidota bacterium]|nr:cytochrome c peroxidase [Bacteroidota bacterium]